MFDPELKLDKDQPSTWDWEHIFGRSAPMALEIGTGNGVFMASEARKFPEWNFVGIERAWEFFEKFKKRMIREGLANVRCVSGDVYDFLPQAFEPGALDRVILNFSDPWPKRKHRDRRVVRAPFLEQMERLLAPGRGVLEFKTDVGWLFNLTIRQIRLRPGWRLEGAGPMDPPDTDKGDPMTTFERHAREGGIQVWGFTAKWVGRKVERS